MSFTGQEIANITKGRITCDFEGDQLSIDSRIVNKNDIFVALPGANDGHNFVADAIKRGAAGAIVTRIPEGLDEKAPLVIVENSKEAIVKLAEHNRKTINAKYIAITGSAGKTSTKEMLKIALEEHGNTFAGFGNYNNDLGVPVCMASIPKNSDYVILEAGMNQPGEINYLSKLIHPDISIVTNVEPVHLWSFENVAAIAKEKASIVDGLVDGGVAIINNQSKEFDALLEYLEQRHVKKITVGPKSDCSILNYQVAEDGAMIEAKIFDQHIRYKLGFTSPQQISNSLFPLVLSAYLGLDVQKSADALYNFKLLKGRGEICKLNNGATLIDDSYNANPASLAAALENLSKYQGKKLAIMADMLELGKDAKLFHAGLYNEQVFSKIDGVITCGEMMENLYQKLPKHLQKGHFKNYADIMNNIGAIIENYDVILVKGSKGTSLYKIIDTIKA